MISSSTQDFSRDARWAEDEDGESGFQRTRNNAKTEKLEIIWWDDEILDISIFPYVN